jgi:putative hemolysin
MQQGTRDAFREIVGKTPTAGSLSSRSAVVPLARSGLIEARLARSPAEVRAAQRLRYQVFHRELGARPSLATRLLRRDADRWDRACDHLLALAAASPDGGAASRVVGACRLLAGDAAARAGLSFYSAGEFAIGPMIERHCDKKFLELGRSCIAADWRNTRAAEFLWSAIWSYARGHAIDVMVGCASFAGADPARHGEALAFLLAHAPAAGEWEVRALPGRGVPLGGFHRGAIDAKRAIRALPPLIRGYLRLGARFAGEAVVDGEFATTDVFVILPVAAIGQRYLAWYGAAGRRDG